VSDTVRTRREPPAFRHATVTRVARRSPRLVRLTLAGPELAGFELGLPAASVRLLVPAERERRSGLTQQAGPVVLPVWNGNEFLHADGSRPPIRTLTPLRFDPATDELDVEVVLHGEGPLSTWAAGDPLGDPTAVSGPGRGYALDPACAAYVVAGDESAVPAIGMLLEAIPHRAVVTTVIEARAPVEPVGLPHHPGATVRWLELPPGAAPGSTLLDAVAAASLDGDTRVWVAGEAAGVQRIRQHLFTERSFPRARATVRGYWKVGRGGDDVADA
jgi:NADPH-dependent ferric siderophore reductase